ncbi:hypothetical protein LMG7143_04445 [Ralstonia thomasii]|uniref:prepilin type IV pili n=1 Tax=Ralstonia thomasii TaxID=3058596 RepID=UPI0028F5C51F|nr:prepilin type IV pili [Ralstonia sp. LMG 18095]CAJ0718552.1 hypothetical protein LMG7143_04445 [Ralstonia sp. LMG 18095]
MRDFLLTMGGVIISLLLVALAGAALYGGFNTGKASNLVTAITLIESNARAGFAQSSQGYTNFTTANVGTLASGGGMFPRNMVKNGVLTDDWGNAMQLSSANNGSQGVITFGGGGSQDVDQCQTFVTNHKDYVSLVVGGTTFTQTNQPDAFTAKQACQGTPTLAVTFQ